MTNVSGSGFLSKISTRWGENVETVFNQQRPIFKLRWLKCHIYSSTSGSTDGFRQNDPGLKKWQSLSHLAPEGATRPFPPTPGAELRAAQGDSSFRPTEVVHWLQDAQERIDTQLDRLRARDARLSYNITTAQLLDMKHKVSKIVSRFQWKQILRSTFFFAFFSLIAIIFSNCFTVFFASKMCLLFATVPHCVLSPCTNV